MSTQHHLQGRENLDTLFAFDSGESTGSSLASGTPLGSPGRGAQRQARLGAVLQGRVAREGGSGREHLGRVWTGPGKLVEAAAARRGLDTKLGFLPGSGRGRLWPRTGTYGTRHWTAGPRHRICTGAPSGGTDGAAT